MTPTPTRILQDPFWFSRKCTELAKITYFTAYYGTLNPVKRSNWPVFVSNLWIEVIITCDLQNFVQIFLLQKSLVNVLYHVMASDPQAVDLLTVPCKLRHNQPNKGLFLMGEVTFNVDAQKS